VKEGGAADWIGAIGFAIVDTTGTEAVSWALDPLRKLEKNDVLLEAALPTG
jgi:hypothetical protein